MTIRNVSWTDYESILTSQWANRLTRADFMFLLGMVEP